MSRAIPATHEEAADESVDESSAACVDAARQLASDLANSPITSSQRWKHTFGEMLIQTRANGTVWINGQLVRDTAPGAQTTDMSAGPGAPR